MVENLILLVGQGAQMLLVLLIAPGLTGITRRTKARFMRRQGAPVIQPYRDILKLIRKESVLAENASWLFRSAPYAIVAFTWVASALVPTFAFGLMFNWAADAVALVALLGAGRAILALAGMDIGTGFGGIGSSREMMIATLAEPAMLLVLLTMSLTAGTTRLPEIAEFLVSSPLTVRVSLALALTSMLIVALAENARIPIDNPATHLELTMVHEAMVLEYSGRHLAMIELAAQLKLVLYISLIICLFLPFGMASASAGPGAWLAGLGLYLAKAAACAVVLGAWEASIAKMRVFRVGEFLGGAFVFAFLAILLAFVSREVLQVSQAYDVSHLLAGLMLVASFALLYQDRIFAVLNIFAAQAVFLALAVGWEAWTQERPHLFVTAALALGLKGIVIPVALHKMILRLGIHRDVEQVVGVGKTLMAGLALTSLSLLLVLKITTAAESFTREGLALALAIILLGFLMMISRRNAVTQIVGFMSLENGLILAATGARGMPLVVEISVAFSVLIALFVFAVFVFRIRERFDSVDIEALEDVRGDLK